MTCSITDCERKAHCRGWCQSHYRRWRLYGDAEVLVLGEDVKCATRECRVCGAVLPIEQFYSRASGSRRRECKPCHRTAATNSAKAVEVGDARWMRRRDGTLRRKYGIGNAEFNALLERQDGRCALCDEKPRMPKRTKYDQWTAFHVDHCHRTGRVRGLLCARCNASLGWVEANPLILQRVEKYLAA